MQNSESDGTDTSQVSAENFSPEPESNPGHQDIDEYNDEPVEVYLKHRQEEVLEALSRGEITGVTGGQGGAIESLVSHFLENGFLKKALTLFPDPRKNWEVPMDCLLLPHILQRLHDEHSLLLAPYLLNSASLVTKLGYNVKILEEGFNKKNKKKRKTPHHGETLKHVLNAADAEKMVSWFNQGLRPSWQRQAERAVGKKGARRQFIMDGMKIEIPGHLLEKYAGAGVVRNEDNTLSYGYKVVWIQQVLYPQRPELKRIRILTRSEEEREARLYKPKGILVGLRIGPIQEHDQSLGKWLASEFEFKEGDELIFDRGFIDGEWIGELKKKKGVNIYVPLKRNMKLVKEAILSHEFNPDQWEAHPTREEQWVKSLTENELKVWDENSTYQSGVLVRWKNQSGVFEYVVFVSTKKGLSPTELLTTYDLRSRIEETHRQLKIFQGFETLLSKKWEHVVFQILMGVMAFNLLTLYLISEKGESLGDVQSLKTLRQHQSWEEKKDPQSIIYTEFAFAVLTQKELLIRVLEIEDAKIRKKLMLVLRP